MYIDSHKVDDEVVQHLTQEVEVRPYASVFEDLKKLNAEKKVLIDSYRYLLSKKIWLDPYKASLALFNCVDASNAIIKQSKKISWNFIYILGPIALAKSLKNPSELEGLRQCHLRDGAALVKHKDYINSH